MPVEERPSRRRVLGSLAGLLLALLLAALDQTVVGPALPRVVESLQGFERYAWVATSYMLCSTVMVPIAGKMADLYGRKGLLLAGVSGFVAASALCGWAGQLPLPLDGMNQLILFRGLQGLAGGILVAMAFTVIGDLFEPEERPRYQGLFGSVWGLASLVGPLLGGWLTDHLSWRWVFFVNVPVGAVALGVLAVYFQEVRHPRAGGRLDGLGIALFVTTVVPLLVATTAWQQPAVLLGALALAALSLLAFVAWEQRAPEPLIPFRLFRLKIFWTSVVTVFLVGTVMFGAILYVPLFVQAVLGRSATESGAVLTPMTLMMVAGSFVGGQILARLGNYRGLALTGLLVMLAGQILLGALDGHANLAALTASLVVLGLGLGLAMPLFNVLVQNHVPQEDLGTATSLVTFFRSIGGTVGATVWGGLLAHRLGGVDLHSITGANPQLGGAFSLMYFLGAVLLLPTLWLASGLPEGRPWWRGRARAKARSW